MAGRGKVRASLADLGAAVGENSVIDGEKARPAVVATPAGPPSSAPLTDLVANPRNPRDQIGDLSDLASIAQRQLQRALVITRTAYLRLYAEDEDKLGAARWVVVNGCRRLAAAHLYGRVDLEIDVKDEIAASRADLLAASITENVARANFDVLEEARAVEALVAECGDGETAGKQLGRTKGWVSQRRALLKLAPELQQALRRGELAIRDARSLARVPREEQVSRWLAAQDKPVDDAPRGKRERPAADAPSVERALKKLAADPGTLAVALTGYLDRAQLHTLVDTLTATLGEST